MAKTKLLLLVCELIGLSMALNDKIKLYPPMGWNTWCTLGQCGHDYCSEEEIFSIADAMEKNGMKKLGYEYINLDDCWADYRDEEGNIIPDYSRFPNGMEYVAKHLDKKGFKFGLYTDAGVYTCSNGLRDHKIPGSYGHYKQDAETYAKWGAKYVKMDWCGAVILVNGTQLDPRVIYKNMSDALRAANPSIVFNSCEGGVMDQPWEWIYKYADTWRIWHDHHDNWDSTSEIIEVVANLGVYAGPNRGWNDLDFLMTGGQGGCDPSISGVHCPGQTDDEYRTEFTIWCLVGSPLLVATDVRNMTAIMKEVLYNKDLIAINQDPLGAPGIRIFLDQSCKENSCQIWAKDLHDGSKAVVLLNTGDQKYVISLDPSFHLGFDTKVIMKDLWKSNAKPLIYDTGKVHQAQVPPHGVAAYKIFKA